MIEFLALVESKQIIPLHGRRLCELQRWGNFRVPMTLVQNVTSFANSFTSACTAAANDVSLQDGRKGKNFAVSYLVDSLGFTSKLAESISRKVSFEEKGNPDSVLSLLRGHGFTDSQISSIITVYPGLLILDAEKSLGPKLKFLQSRGASSSELTKIVSTVPKILGKKAGKCISRHYDFVKEIIEADRSSKVENLCHSLPQGSKKENKIRNVLVLRELGVPQKLLFSLLVSKFSSVYGKENFEKSLKKVLEMGFDPTSSRFVNALQVVYGMSDDTIEEKVNVYTRLGFDVGDVWEMFKKWPLSLAYSEKKITQRCETLKKCGLLEDEVLSVFKKFPQCIGLSEKRIENCIETFLGLGFSRDEFVMMVKRFPQCLGYSLVKRIVPRCNVIKALISKRLLRGSEVPSVSSLFSCTDEVFLKRYVMIYNDDKHLVLELMSYLHGKKQY